MIAELYITPPQANYTTGKQRIAASVVTITPQMQYATVLTAFVETGWDVYYNEADTNSAIQMRADVRYWEDGVRKFWGRVKSIQRTIQDGIPGVLITATDKLDYLNEVLATYKPGSTPLYTFSRETPQLAHSNRTFTASYAYDGFRHVWYPNLDSFATHATANSGPYLSRAVANHTTTTGSTAHNATEIKLQQTYPGFAPSGFVTIHNDANNGHNCVQYDGCTYNQSNGYWYLNNCQWDKLGATTSFTAASGNAVYAVVSKRIHYGVLPRVQGDAGGTWETIIDSKYKINYDEGALSFTGAPLAMRGGGSNYASIRVSYATYDEEDAGNQLLLSTVFTEMLRIASDDLGPALSAPEFDVSFSPALVVSRITIDKPTYLGTFIRDLLAELGLNKGSTNDAIGFYYDSEADTICIKTLAQSATPDRIYNGEQSRYEECDVDDVYSAVCVQYETAGNYNLVSERRMWHPKSYDKTAGTYPRIVQYQHGDWVQHEAAWIANPHVSNLGYKQTAAGVQSSDYYWTDNDGNTSIGLFWGSDPGASKIVLYAWFPGTLSGGAESTTQPDDWTIDTVTIAYRLVGESQAYATGNARGTVVYYTSFTGATSANDTLAGAGGSAGTAMELSNNLRWEFTPGTIGEASYVKSATDLNITCQAIGIQIDGWLKVTEVTGLSPIYGTMIADIYVSGTQKRSETVKLKATYSTSTRDLVAPNSYAKLVDTTTGIHKTLILDIGPATRETALNLAWLQLLQSLALAQSRTYFLNSGGIDAGLGMPTVGETVQFSDGFIGLVDSATYTNDHGARSLEVRAINYNTTLFGAGV